jgi:hypothetical protein
MDLPGLYLHLAADGFGHLGLRTGSSRIDLLDLSLSHDDDSWQVSDLERGEVIEIHGRFKDVGDACTCFLDRVRARYWFLIGWRSLRLIEATHALLADAGIGVLRNDCPDPDQSGGALFRLFVPGSSYAQAVTLVQDNAAWQDRVHARP